jgi:L-iditol 2-dehydrogenase
MYGLTELGGLVAGECGRDRSRPDRSARGCGGKGARRQPGHPDGTCNRRLAIGRELGADRVVNINDENAVEVVRQVTGGIGADYVVECAGTEATVNQATALRYARDRVEDAIKVAVTNREAGTIARAAE